MQDDRSPRPNITTRAPTKAEIDAFMAREFPQCKCHVLEVGAGAATVAHDVGAGELRPGGTVSGPVLMTVADVGLYVALLGEIGIVPLAVTTNLTINFLRKPSAARRILGVCRMLKVGKVQAVGEVSLYSEGTPQAVAHAVGTYSIPRLEVRHAPR
jgi:acyl-coenzyme A thioesterase PaaI-like protein